MSHQELRDDHKQSEGDPHVKQQRRQRATKSPPTRCSPMCPRPPWSSSTRRITRSRCAGPPTASARRSAWPEAPTRSPRASANGRRRPVCRSTGIRRPRAPCTPPPASVHEIDPDQYAPVAAAIRFAEAMRAKSRRAGYQTGCALMDTRQAARRSRPTGHARGDETRGRTWPAGRGRAKPRQRLQCWPSRALRRRPRHRRGQRTGQAVGRSGAGCRTPGASPLERGAAAPPQSATGAGHRRLVAPETRRGARLGRVGRTFSATRRAGRLANSPWTLHKVTQRRAQARPAPDENP